MYLLRAAITWARRAPRALASGPVGLSLMIEVIWLRSEVMVLSCEPRVVREAVEGLALV